MKNVVLVASHFPPSNLAAVHRSRLWALHLREFGWNPIILTSHHRYYEEELDESLFAMLPKWLRVIRVPAFSTKPIRLVGDVGVRSFPWMWKALNELVASHVIDFLHITIPSNFLAPLGGMLKKKYNMPFGIDYIDPWVHDWPGSKKFGSKHWLSRKLADILEPLSVRTADLITGINPEYYSGMLERNPKVEKNAVLSAMPYGGTVYDFDCAEKFSEKTIQLFGAHEELRPECKIWVYAGAFLPKATNIYRAFFEGLANLKKCGKLSKDCIKLVFIGTGNSPTNPEGHQVLPLAREAGVDDLVIEHPQRMGYGHVLAHLQAADGVLVIGSNERHYSPSKTYQALMSGRPVWVALHSHSSAWKYLPSEWGCEGVRLEEKFVPEAAIFAESFARAYDLKRDFSFERGDLESSEISARQSAKILATALDTALARHRKSV